MSKVCPICKNSLNEVIPEVCEICGWNLSEDITLFPVLNEISKEEIEEYKKKVDTARGSVRKMRIYNAKEFFLTIPTFLTTLRYV